MSPVERLKRSGKRNRFTAICLLICLGAAIIQGVLPSAVASAPSARVAKPQRTPDMKDRITVP